MGMGCLGEEGKMGVDVGKVRLARFRSGWGGDWWIVARHTGLESS